MRKRAIFPIILALVLVLQTFSAVGYAEKSETKTKEQVSVTDKSSSKEKTDSNDKKTEEKSETKTKEFPKPRAKSAVVIDANSGSVIYALNADKKLSTAGTSNIMTAIVALENASLGDSFTVTEEALKNVKYDQPQLGMKVGETHTLEELLYAILLNSDNDAANTIAIGVSGSIEDFVKKMNDKAVALKLSNTHYENPTGMYNKKHYMSAEDLAKLARYAMKNETFRTIVKTPTYSIFANQKDNTLLSTNHLVSRYKYPYHYYNGATGVKSGNSTEAGYCLAASAEKNGLSLISVVMGCDNQNANEGAYSFVDTAAMLNYVFENYQSVLLTKQGDVVFDSKVSEAKNSTRVALTVEDDVYITLKKSIDADSITNEVAVIQDLKAPIHKGDYFGTISYFYNGKEIKTANIVAANEVKRDFILHIISSILHFIFNPIVLIILIAILAIWVRMRIVRNRKRRERRKRLVSQNNSNYHGSHSDISSNRSHSFDDYKRR